MEKLSISMTIFNSYFDKLPEGKHHKQSGGPQHLPDRLNQK
jgi:hypothetical protein